MRAPSSVPEHVVGRARGRGRRSTQHHTQRGPGLRAPGGSRRHCAAPTAQQARVKASCRRRTPGTRSSFAIGAPKPRRGQHGGRLAHPRLRGAERLRAAVAATAAAAPRRAIGGRAGHGMLPAKCCGLWAFFDLHGGQGTHIATVVCRLHVVALATSNRALRVPCMRFIFVRKREVGAQLPCRWQTQRSAQHALCGTLRADNGPPASRYSAWSRADRDECACRGRDLHGVRARTPAALVLVVLRAQAQAVHPLPVRHIPAPTRGQCEPRTDDGWGGKGRG